MTFQFATKSSDTLPLSVIDKDGFDAWRDAQPDGVAAWVTACGFSGAMGTHCMVPGSDGSVASVVVGYGTAAQRARGRFALAAAVPSLPKGSYDIDNGIPADMIQEETLGWLLCAYTFDRYRSQSGAEATLVAPDGVDADRLIAMATGEALTRDLINTPTSDMGPAQLEQACRDLAAQHGATVKVTTGDALLKDNFPMIHTVGRASADAPRLVDMSWGKTGPKLTLVGKGVCFDTGGLNLKPGSSMGLMKKDMGGAANVLGLAHMIMALEMPIQLRVLIPAVENSVSSNAFRPQDILTSRKGLTVEINNTDAEGRLVLADALTLAAEDDPDLTISMATLTGAARVAVGPDLAPFFSRDPADASAIATAATTAFDPVWQLPLHAPYESMIEPGIADLDNAPKGGFAGAITAALFLARFTDSPRYMHFDIYGWQPTAAPARPKGGVQQGPRAILNALPELLNL